MILDIERERERERGWERNGARERKAGKRKREKGREIKRMRGRVKCV